MPLEQAPDDRLTHTQARKSRPIAWGSLQQTVARHGIVTSRLIVYPPDASERDRLRAHRFRNFTPIALGAGTVCWLLLIAAGASPEASAVVLLALIAPVGIALWRGSRPLRSRTISLWSNRSGLWPHPDDERREEMLTELSSVMQAACDDMRSGRITGDAFSHIWDRVYQDALIADSADRAQMRRGAVEDDL